VVLACFHQPTRVRLVSGWHQVPANTLVAWLPGMAQDYGVADAAWIHSWLHLRGSLASALVASAALPTGVVIPLPSCDVLETPLIELHGERVRPSPDQAIIEALATVLVRRLARLAPRQTDALDEVHRQIVAHPAQRQQLANLAAIAGCSPQHLCRVFRERFGVTPVALASGVRLDRAAQLLRDGLSPTEVAETCGWADGRQFARVFSARFGASPAAWARRA
jgi:AraC-like DNA-binding protein